MAKLHLRVESAELFGGDFRFLRKTYPPAPFPTRKGGAEAVPPSSQEGG